MTFPVPLELGVAGATGRLILVAEDNEINATVITHQLALLGYESHVAVDGEEAFRRYHERPYSMLLTDLHMPLLDGYELTSAIRQDEAHGTRMPIIALTANASKEEARRCMAVGMNAYMTKPLQLVELQAMLAKWMPAAAQPLLLRGQDNRESQAHTPPTTGDARPPAEVERPAPMDLSVLIDIVGSDPGILEELLRSFRRSAIRAQAAMRQGSQSGRLDEVVATAHSFKSGARSVGAKRLGSICDALETAAANKDEQEVATQLDRLDHELAEVIRFLDLPAKPAWPA